MRWLLIAISTLGIAAYTLSAGDGDNLPDGEGKDVLLRMCVNCHGLDQVIANKYPKSLWANVVDDMVTRGAEGSDDDVTILVSYLSRNFGKPVNINTSTAKEIQDGLSFTAADSELIVKYRTDKGTFKTYEDVSKVPGIDTKVLDEQKKNIQF